MAAWRNQARPSENPGSFSSFFDIISRRGSANLRTYISGNVNYNRIVGQGYEGIVILDQDFARSIMSEVSSFCIHVSYTSIPSSAWCEELVSILCIKNGFVSIIKH